MNTITWHDMTPNQREENRAHFSLFLHSLKLKTNGQESTELIRKRAQKATYYRRKIKARGGVDTEIQDEAFKEIKFDVASNQFNLNERMNLSTEIVYLLSVFANVGEYQRRR